MCVKWKCSCCDGYRRTKWIWRAEFKSWTRLFGFHIEPILSGKVCLQQFFLKLWGNSRADWALQPWYATYSKRRKTKSKPVRLQLKNWPCVVSCSCIYIYIYIYIYTPPSRRLSTLAKELPAATRVMQSSSNELVTLVSDSAKM